MTEVITDSGLILATFFTSILASKAVMAISAHGFDTTLGADAAIGYGFAHVGKTIHKKDSKW